MRKIQVTIKNVDEYAFNELKAEAARNKMPVGSALTLAIHQWLTSSKNRPLLPLLQGKMIKGKPGTERLSEQVDDILYGEYS